MIKSHFGLRESINKAFISWNHFFIKKSTYKSSFMELNYGSQIVISDLRQESVAFTTTSIKLWWTWVTGRADQHLIDSPREQIVTNGPSTVLPNKWCPPLWLAFRIDYQLHWEQTLMWKPEIPCSMLQTSARLVHKV